MGLDSGQALNEQATAEAREAAAVASTRAEVGRVQEWTLQARRAAEKADAATRAPALWALAVGVQRSAEEALTRQDVGQAQALWRKAEKGYRDAERAAIDAAAAASAAEQARLVTQQREFQQAEQAGAAARRARRDAEQAQVPRYASQMIAVAAAKEQEAQTALDRQDYVTAQQRFREAQQEYQRAAQEAQAAAEAERSRTAALQRQVAEEAQRLATLQETMGQARTELATSRQAALQSEADRLAPSAFASARSKEAEADGLAAQQKFAVAALAYRDATRRYDEAQRRAQLPRGARVEADQARTAMLAEKQKARRGAPDFGAAVREEQQATALYDALDFANATQHFQAARTLFAKTATLQPPPALPRFMGDRGGSGDKGGDRGGDKGGGHK